MSETAKLLKRREDWLKVAVTVNRHGSHDVVLILDGSYAEAVDAMHNAASFRRQIAEAMKADGLPLGERVAVTTTSDDTESREL